MSEIHCRQLCKTFQQGDEIITGLDHVDLDIEAGEFLCLSGPSGSGKTTLLNAIGGLDTPDSGEIHMGDIRIDRLERGPLADMRLHHIGFVFQAYNLIPVLTALENVEFILQLQGVPGPERRERAGAVLAALGLADLGDRRPGELSGGQQQRVAICRAIVTEPVLLLADEPSANLDSKTTEELLAELARLNREQGMTIVTATHDPMVMQFTTRQVKLRDGAVEQDSAALPA